MKSPWRVTLGQTRQDSASYGIFYWPTVVFKDLEEFCKCCEICQKTSSRKASPAPLMPLPIIESFKKVAMDIVGPLPRSRSGNVYILVLCDYATRLPRSSTSKGY